MVLNCSATYCSLLRLDIRHNVNQVKVWSQKKVGAGSGGEIRLDNLLRGKVFILWRGGLWLSSMVIAERYNSSALNNPASPLLAISNVRIKKGSIISECAEQLFRQRVNSSGFHFTKCALTEGNVACRSVSKKHANEKGHSSEWPFS